MTCRTSSTYRDDERDFLDEHDASPEVSDDDDNISDYDSLDNSDFRRHDSDDDDPGAGFVVPPTDHTDNIFEDYTNDELSPADVELIAHALQQLRGAVPFIFDFFNVPGHSPYDPARFYVVILWRSGLISFHGSSYWGRPSGDA